MNIFSKFRQINVEKAVFYLIIFLFPINLGYHFVLAGAYVGGVLIDYLVPTIFTTDILVALFVVVYRKKIKKSEIYKQKYFVWFLSIVFFSILGSGYKLVGFFYLARLTMYFLFMIYIKSNISFYKEQTKIFYVVSISIFLLCILSIFQWLKQGSVFDNYLFFGEQPYNFATRGINVENFFGVSKIPPYATFRHPNILGGILSIVLVWLAFAFKKNKIFFKLCFILAFIILFLSLSFFSWISALLGLLLLFFNKNFIIKNSIILVIFIFWTCSFFLPYIEGLSFLDSKPSFYRRRDLISSSYEIIKNNFWFGVGPQASTAFVDRYLPPSGEFRISQPPHNIFMMVFVETGIFGFLLFISFYLSQLIKAKKNSLLLISLLQIMFLGSVDHYFLSIHQPLLFLFFILGFV